MDLKQKTALKSNNYLKNSLYSVSCIIGLIISPQSWSKSDEKAIIVYADEAMPNISTTAKTYTVINTSQPKYQYASDALGLLKKTPGLSLSGIGSTNGQTLNMRGYEKSGVLITIDGIRQDINAGTITGTFLDPMYIKKIIAIQGSNSLQHGSGALGGTIALKTVTARDLLAPEQSHGAILTLSHSRNDQGYQYGSLLFGKTHHVDGLMALSRRTKGSSRLSNGSIPYNKEDIHNLLAKGNWMMTPSYIISAQLRYYQNEGIQLKNPEVVEPSKYKNSRYDRNTSQYDIQLTQKIYPLQAENWLIDWDLYYSKVIIEQKPIEQVKHSLFSINKHGEEKRSLISKGSKITHYFIWDHDQFAAHHFNIGSEFNQQQQEANEQADFFPPATLRNIAVWLEDEIRLNTLPITFSIGTRYSNYRNNSDKYSSNQDSQWTSRGAVSFTPTNWLELFSSYAEGYRTPSLNEIYNDSKHFAQNYFKPNPNLQPERNQTIEYGINLQFNNKLLTNDRLQWRTAVFNTKATNYITTVIHGFPPIGNTLSINTPSVVIHGIDSSLNYITPWFNAALAYNRTHAKDTITGMSISSIRPESLTASLDLPLANSGFSLGWVGQFAAKTNLSGDRKTGRDKYRQPIMQQAGYGVNDFYIHYQGDGQLSGINTTLSLTNAFNKSYSSSLGVPQEGRNIHFKINYRW
ncbi:TonB-dependent receptor [Arsenophonus nasoniae]|uniref:Hemin receptor n=3 Tax=Arsenophonus nasoniae TaxID=638 RepID=D2TW07_9GAMM|nr:TonB-dependent receptor [Arsenophonus nasoniae]QBY43631.1 Hemin receptor [Arsenophonus nasoniae]WGM17114.1 TonB-dependent receptor [Arsenophonus nasoniae]CBA71537.1 hemin receptor [Arsenophonus nasoniae]